MVASLKHMNATLKRLYLLAALSDQQTEIRADRLVCRCLHCRRTLELQLTGEPRTPTTLEHIVPQAWFGKTAAKRICALVGEPNDARNLALACPNCNQGKGKSHDANGPRDERAVEVIQQLLARRLARMKAAG
jgi:5-methylcytosine-specific restriction endonuclease McrA